MCTKHDQASIPNIHWHTQRLSHRGGKCDRSGFLGVLPPLTGVEFVRLLESGDR
ncbi:hypothetical protein M404DRAFT_389150 [Pisolithus tinctorius Marx 270]|uniref:Uncharacterized protein n=1 Tax=Pisolithus tinctorius Marx 270 TaxID=870435 RepID=A0A0C3PHS2_PISTI|nr:hypothetical protein M404DRAFT_389150 [Pisolithus tinctorius Marx 270]